MPEIWLPYGSVEVALDIKAENLFTVLEKQNQRSLSEDEIGNRLEDLEIRGPCSILLPDPSHEDFKLLETLIPILESRGLDRSDLAVFTRVDSVKVVRKKAQEFSVNVSEAKQSSNSQEAFTGQSSFPTLLTISQLRFDPMFGFSGGPLGFSKLVCSSIIEDAFFSHIPVNPVPGERTESAKFIEEHLLEYSQIPTIQYVSGGGSISALFAGPLLDCYKKASEALRQTNRISFGEKLKGSIVSPGRLIQSTLSLALKGVWNSIEILKEKGTLAIISESSDGFGSEALRLHSLGRLDLKALIKNKRYIDGMEEVIFLKTLAEKFDILVVSSLPNYYLQRQFGFSTARRVGDALNQMLEKYGRRTKLVVVPNASEILIS